MKKNILILVTLAIFVSATAYADPRGVVINEGGKEIRSSLSKECVRTRWVVGQDPCLIHATGQNKLEVFEIPQLKPQKSVQDEHFVVEQHNRAYLVFFDFGQVSITQSGADILEQLVKEVQKTQSVSFVITGHADRVGSHTYNTDLSKKRAQRVKDYLVGLGVSPANVDIFWKGEEDPLVQTANGIREPQNRRVEIKVSAKIRVKR